MSLSVGVPAREVPGHLLLDRLAQRVGALRADRVLLVDGDVRRGRLERQPEDGLAGCPDDVLDAGAAGGAEHVVGGDDVVGERRTARAQARRRDGREVDHRVDAVVPVVDAGERLGDLAQVGEVDAAEHRLLTGGRQGRVDVDHVVPVRREILHDRTPELALTHR